MKGSWIHFKLLRVLGDQLPTLPFIKGVTSVEFSLLCVIKDYLWGNSRPLSLSEPSTSSRKTQDLPARAFSLTLAECQPDFVQAIFSLGKGTRARPDVHLWGGP